MRLRSPSTTLTLTTTVSPVAKSGIVLPRRLISSLSSCSIRFIFLLLGFLLYIPRLLLLSIGFVGLLEFLQQSFFLDCQPALDFQRQQIGASQPCPAQRLLQAPAFYSRVIPRH